MTTFFTSDTHFGHVNIIKYSERPYTSVEEMNEGLIQKWNEKIQPGDTVYHLGDVAFCNEDGLERILRRLNGNKHLIFGNHDRLVRRSDKLLKYFMSFQDYLEISVMKQKVILCHFAMLVWNQSHRGSWMLHGHSHGTLKYPYPMRIMDVGVDPRGQYPISFEDVKRYMDKIKVEFPDHHTDKTNK